MFCVFLEEKVGRVVSEVFSEGGLVEAALRVRASPRCCWVTRG